MFHCNATMRKNFCSKTKEIISSPDSKLWYFGERAIIAENESEIRLRGLIYHFATTSIWHSRYCLSIFSPLTFLRIFNLLPRYLLSVVLPKLLPVRNYLSYVLRRTISLHSSFQRCIPNFFRDLCFLSSLFTTNKRLLTLL